MKSLIKFCFITGLAMSFNQVYGFEELGEIGSAIPVLNMDERKVGWEWHFVDEDGNPGFMKKTADTATTASYWRSDGCTWTRMKSGFAPALEWENCPSSGTSAYELYGDPIWPLKVGNKFGYKGSGASKSKKKAKKFNRKCEVLSQQRLKTVLGEFDSYKVRCKDRWITRYWWLSPEVGTAVLYRQKNFIGGLLHEEMTSIIQ